MPMPANSIQTSVFQWIIKLNVSLLALSTKGPTKRSSMLCVRIETQIFTCFLTCACETCITWHYTYQNIIKHNTIEHNILCRKGKVYQPFLEKVYIQDLRSLKLMTGFSVRSILNNGITEFKQFQALKQGTHFNWYSQGEWKEKGSGPIDQPQFATLYCGACMLSKLPPQKILLQNMQKLFQVLILCNFRFKVQYWHQNFSTQKSA